MPLILTETRGRVGILRLNRPEALNALNDALISELAAAVDAFDASDAIGAMLLTGSDRAFAAGADIKEMAALSASEAAKRGVGVAIQRIAAARKPIVAAVAGHCLGGGLELASMCDILIAADTAKFAQPEITLGIVPGMGGTQRLPRAVGKAKAMDVILTGRTMGAEDAERAGLVSRVVPAAELFDAAFAVAERIASLPLPAVLAAKQAVLAAYDTPLGEGIRTERRLFHALFDTADQKEGMAAFLEKRPPSFRNR
jgi:enoyl-CoA hydratase